MIKLTIFALNRATVNNHGETVYINPARISFIESRTLGVVLTKDDYNTKVSNRIMETATLITFQGDDSMLVQEPLGVIAELVEAARG